MMLGPQDCVGPHRNRGANDRAEVLRIFELVEGDDESIVVERCFFELHQRKFGSYRDGSLMASPFGHLVELGTRNALHFRPLIFGEASDRVQLRGVPFFNENTLDTSTVSTDRFAYRLEAGN